MLVLSGFRPFSRRTSHRDKVGATTTTISSRSKRNSLLVMKPDRQRNVSGNTLETQPSESSLTAHLDESDPSTMFTVLHPPSQARALSPSLPAETVMIMCEEGMPLPSSPPVVRHPHRRCRALMEQDYDELYCRSRAWMYDPTLQEVSKPRHRDRYRNRSLCAYDFDKFIFRSEVPRLG